MHDAPRPDRRQRHHRHADLPLAGAGQRRTDRAGHRPLRRRHPPVRDAHRRAAVPRRLADGDGVAHRDTPVPPLTDKRPDVPTVWSARSSARSRRPAGRCADADEMRAALADAVPAPWAAPSRPPRRRHRSSPAHASSRCRPRRPAAVAHPRSGAAPVPARPDHPADPGAARPGLVPALVGLVLSPCSARASCSR